MKAWVLSFCLLLLPVVGLAADQKDLQPAKVISQEIGAYNGGAAVVPLNGALIGLPIIRRSNVVMVEYDNKRETWVEGGRPGRTGRGLLVLPVNGTLYFYRDGNNPVVTDNAGKKHKFGVVHIENLPEKVEK